MADAESSFPDDPDSPETHHTLRQRIGLFLGPALMLLLLALPMPGLKPEAHRLAGVMALVVTYWISEAIPLAATAFLGPVLAILLGVAEDKKIYAPFASPVIFQFVGSFMLAAAMQKYHLDRRFAARLLAIPALSRSPARLFVALGLLTTCLSMWMSNAATTAMMLPIALAAAQSWPALRDNPAAIARLVLLIAFAASIGGAGTPVGTPPNLIGLGALKETTGVTISFVQWMQLGVPLALVQLACLLPLLARQTLTAGTAPDAPHQSFLPGTAARRPWARGEVITICVFLLAVSLWMLPGLLDLAAGTGKSPLSQFLHAHFPEETVGLLAGVLLMLIPVDWRTGRMTLTWKEAVRIDWGTIFIFAGGMALGKQLFDTGLAAALGNGLVTLISHVTTPGLWTLVGFGIVLSLIVSEAASNTASATVMVPLMIAIAQSAHVDPVPVALASCLASSFGFLLPVSTGPNALAYGTGRVPLTTMIRHGAALDVIGAITIFAAIWLAYGRIF